MEKRKIILYAVIGALIIAVAAVLWPFVSGTVVAVLISAVLSFLLRPLVERLKKYMPVSMAILGIFAVVLIAAVFIVTAVIPELQNQFTQLEQTLPQIRADINGVLDGVQRFADRIGLRVSISSILDDLGGDPNQIAGDAVRWLVTNIGKLSYIAVIPALTYYLLKDGGRLYARMGELIDEQKRGKWRKIYRNIHRRVWQFVVGQGVLVLIVALATWAVLVLCGVRFSLLLAVFMGLMEFIPYFGPFIGAIPIVVVALIDGWSTLAFAVIGILIVQQLEGSFLSPLIIGKHTGLHPAWVIVIILIGGEVLGIAGMIVSVPIVIVLKTVIESVYCDYVRNRPLKSNNNL